MIKLISSKQGISICLMFLCSAMALGQRSELHAKVKEIELSTPATVETHKLSIEQDIKAISPSYLEFSVTEINEKGQSEERSYSFGLSDIDKRTLKFFTHKDRMLVEVRANGNQKLIQRSLDGGNKVDYVGDFIMYTRNAANGRNLKAALEDAIPVATRYDENMLNLNTYSDHLEWLENNIENVSLPKEEIGQEVVADDSRPAYAVFERVHGSKKLNSGVNVSLLNPSTLRYEMSGSKLFLEIWTKNNLNAIKYFENDNPTGFGDKLVIYAKNMPHAKKIHRVLKGLVPLAKTHFSRYSPNINSIPSAVKYLNSKIKSVPKHEGSTDQQIKVVDNLVTLNRSESNPKETIENEYIFDINDINSRKIVLDNDKTRFLLELHTKNGQPFIRHNENGNSKNFRKYVRLFFNDIDDALFAEKALQTIIDKNADKLDVKQNGNQNSFYDGLGELQSTIAEVSEGKVRYEQEMELLNREMSALTFTKTISDPKKTRELVYEFSTRDLNKNNIRIEVSGNRVWVELFTTSNQKLVKFLENGKVENYQYRIPIEATDIVNAKEIVAQFKKLEDLDTK